MKRLLLVLALTGCGDSFTDLIAPIDGTEDPPVYDVPAPAVADSLWATLAECALVESWIELHRIEWFRVDAREFRCGWVDAEMGACWMGTAGGAAAIFLAGWIYDGEYWGYARHELMHVWLGVGHDGHDDPSWPVCFPPFVVPEG